MFKQTHWCQKSLFCACVLLLCAPGDTQMISKWHSVFRPYQACREGCVYTVSETCPDAFAYLNYGIDKHAEFTSLFAYEQNGCTIRWHTRPYPTLGQHIIDVLLYNFEFVSREMVLLVSRRCYIFVHQINCMIQRSIWSESRCLKKILKLITKSCVM